MRNVLLVKVVVMLAFILLATVSFARPANAQRRDYLTESEIELVRDAQEIDRRIHVLTQAIDRRFAVLQISAGANSSKYDDKWGEPPQGTRAELFRDIDGLLQKAVDDIDDVASHRSAAPPKEPSTADEKDNKDSKRKAVRFPNAVRSLASAAARYRTALAATLEKSTDDAERGPIMDSIDLCDQIISASTQIPADVQEEKKKRSGKN
jgi:hypothetical protein